MLDELNKSAGQQGVVVIHHRVSGAAGGFEGGLRVGFKLRRVALPQQEIAAQPGLGRVFKQGVDVEDHDS